MVRDRSRDRCAKRAKLDDWLAHTLGPDVRATCSAGHGRNHLQWRLLVEDGRKAGYTFSQPDLIMAARRSIMAAPAVTRNLSDYERVRARVFNPWVDSLPASASSGCGGSLDSSNTTRIEG
jgi:hypothetical protein